MDVIDDIHACQAAAKTFVIRDIYRQVQDEDKRKFMVGKLNSLEFLNHVWLHQLVRNQYKRGHTYVNNQIVLYPENYTVERGKNGVTWLNIMSRVNGKRIPLRFRAGKNTITGRIRLIIKDGSIELHFPRLVWKQPNHANQSIGLDKGYTEVFQGSNGKVYGEGLGKILTSETERRHIKGKHRNKLHAIAKNTKNTRKANRIKQNNLGQIKQNRKLNAAQSQIKSVVGKAVVLVFDDANRLITEDLTQPIKGKQQAKKINRKLSNWTKGVIADMLEYQAERRCSTLILVNACYTSQIDSRNGTLLGHRQGDQFFTFDGMCLQSDQNASVNIENRAADPEITRWMKKEQVQQLLLNRTAKFLETMGMTLLDAVDAGWLDAKHFTGKKGSLKRCTG